MFSASYAIPWVHVPEFLIPHFVGEAINGSYWGPNGIKLHSEYLGLAPLALAAFGAFDPSRRRAVLWLGGIALLFLLVAMGTATPFFRLWWEVVPFVKSTRAPGMALFVVSAVVAILAAFGVHRLEDPKQRAPTAIWLGVGAGVVLFGVLGVFGAIAETLARPESRAWAVTGGSAVRFGAFSAGAALLVVSGLAMARSKTKIPMSVFALGIIVVVGTDLWFNARTFWRYSRAHDELFADDEIKSFLRGVEPPFRVWSVPNPQNGVTVYRQSALMADGIAQWYGHHGNELYSFDVVNARIGMSLSFQNEGHPSLMDLYAIQYLVAPAAILPDSVPGYRFVLRDVLASSGMRASLLERVPPIPYARVVPVGLAIPEEQIVPTLLDDRVPLDRVVIFSDQQGVQVAPIDSLPAPSSIVVTFAEYRPGFMRIELSEPTREPAYLVVAENWYKDWVATIDGEPAEAVQGNGSLITVALETGARVVELRFVSAEFVRGKAMTFASLVLVMIGLVAPPLRRRRRE